MSYECIQKEKKKIVPEYISSCSLVARKEGRISPNSCLTSDFYKYLISQVSNDYIQDCQTDRCVLERAKQKPSTQEAAQKEEEKIYKIFGPTGTSLLSNYDIDKILEQFQLYEPNFFPYNFNMSDYEYRSFVNGRIVEKPDTLYTITFRQLYYPSSPIQKSEETIKNTSYNCAGCIINSDSYLNGGKHWMVLFLDFRREDKWTLEFFNSSGRKPASSWVRFLQRNKKIMEEVISQENKSTIPEIVIVNDRQLQYSKSECGVFCLFYIWCRINNIPYTAISNNPKIRDELMFEFRQHIFQNERADQIKYPEGKFDFSIFQKHNNIRWENSSEMSFDN